MIKVLLFTERDESWEKGDILKAYPQGFKGAFDSFLSGGEFDLRYAYQTDKSCSLTEEDIDWAEVMIWWGHLHHDKVPDALAERVVRRVHEGMGILFLHSSHISKGFLKLIGTSGSLNCFEHENIRERLWTVAPGHDIAAGMPESVDLGQDEMYGEPFGIPEPDETVFMGWFNTGNLFRSGICYYRDNGRVFYFQPGHETFPVYYKPEIQRAIKNAIRWAKPRIMQKRECHWTPPLEKID